MFTQHSALSTQHSVPAKLRQAWRKERRFVHFRGLCHLLIWLVALVLVDLAVDWLFSLSSFSLRLLEAVNLLAIAYILYSRWIRSLKRYDPLRVALAVEKRHPELRSLLVSYVQFTGEGAVQANISPALVAAFKEQALTVTAPLNFKEIVNYRELKKILIFSTCVLAFFAAATVKESPFFSVLFTRLIDPAAQSLYPTKTHLEFISEDVTVPYGAPAELKARVSGVIPAEGTLYVKSKEGKAEPILRPLQGADTYSYRFDSVYQDFDYYFRIGDAKSSVYHVKAVAAPRVSSPKITLHHPRYTQLPDRDVTTLTMQGVPEGTVLQWKLKTDQPVSAAEIVKDGREVCAMSLSADGTEATVSIQALDSFGYQFRWKEKAHGFEYAEDVRYSVQVQPSMPPEVTILFPPEDEKGVLAKTLEVVWRATGEYGLGQATLVYSIGDSPERRVPLEKLTDKTATKAAKRPLRQDIPDLKEKMTVAYYVEVADNRNLADVPGLEAVRPPASGPASQPTGPKIGRSPTRRIEIVTPEEYMAYIQEKRARLISDVGPLYGEETEADKEIKAIIRQLLGHP